MASLQTCSDAVMFMATVWLSDQKVHEPQILEEKILEYMLMTVIQSTAKICSYSGY